MIGLFNQGAVLFAWENPDFPDKVAAAVAGFGIGLLITLIVLFVLLLAAGYIYTSWAFMKLARKVKVKPAGIAWIPFVGPAILMSKAAKMEWWPVLFLIGIFIPFFSGMFYLAFLVFFAIWLWKVYEKVKKPGWWAIFWIVPLVGLIFLGIAAWSRK